MTVNGDENIVLTTSYAFVTVNGDENIVLALAMPLWQLMIMLKPHDHCNQMIWHFWRYLKQGSRALMFYGDRTFAKAAPVLWNKLPLKIRLIDELNVFKGSLKTLYELAYM